MPAASRLPPEITQITLIRGGHSGTIWLQDLYTDPRLDMALRAGDRILVEEDERFYTALGATGAQVKVPFDTQNVSAIEALATVWRPADQCRRPDRYLRLP